MFSKKSQLPQASLNDRIESARRQIVEVIEAHKVGHRSAAKLLAGLADRYHATILLEPLPSTEPPVFRMEPPKRPNILTPLARLIASKS